VRSPRAGMSQGGRERVVPVPECAPRVRG